MTKESKFHFILFYFILFYFSSLITYFPLLEIFNHKYSIFAIFISIMSCIYVYLLYSLYIKSDIYLILKALLFTIFFFLYFFFEQFYIYLFLYGLDGTGYLYDIGVFERFSNEEKPWRKELYWHFIFSLHYPIYIFLFFKPFVNHLDKSIQKIR